MRQEFYTLEIATSGQKFMSLLIKLLIGLKAKIKMV